MEIEIIMKIRLEEYCICNIRYWILLWCYGEFFEEFFSKRYKIYVLGGLVLLQGNEQCGMKRDKLQIVV